ncbi:MAG: AMP-dependent synthetase [Gemmatimonadetes bacterium]|nr:AMP-dependent synthetase [Gemmatimonadota bacterium]|tara:strand:- start:8066 stop:9592 length:1527 start_codon:yes stop_codon:yes gene_type:complete
MPEGATILEVLGGKDDAVAISATDRPDLTYKDLRDQIDRTVEALNGFGIGRNDRVAIVLPNGSEMAVAYLSVAMAATTAPLNPAYRVDEYAFYMEDLSAKVLLVEAGSSSPAVEAAETLNVPILEVTTDDQRPAGSFDLTARTKLSGTPEAGGLAQADDVALVLHTSGTTSRPKIVPLTHTNVCASAGNIRNTLSLTPDDRCMNVMPLFHIHGLMAAILASLSAGASVYCTDGFNALRFFALLEDANPTWYTAVPTMHQAILTRASRNKEIVDNARLRFIRSSSASLPAQVMGELEETFNAPVVEAYAMTESAHQMTCNQLPPGVRKPGTVGPAAGPEVSIMDEAGELVSQGTIGEVVIRGPNVTLGYENNPTANAENFTNGWFRTGDQGVMDEDGYVTITGRLKEIINRGGEKISPREVDDVLMDHPAVQQVVTFAMPHKSLGEDVAAAIVLREGQDASEREVRDFAAEKLADFKVPRKVLFLEEIPKGPTGKMQRIGLAEKLGIGE